MLRLNWDGRAPFKFPGTRSWKTQEVFGSGEPNILCHAECRQGMSSLLEEFGQQVDLIYMDPPFATGRHFFYADPERGEQLAYSDLFELEEYLALMEGVLILTKALLSEKGTFWLHCDWRADWALRALIREIFGPESLINRVIWHYTGGGRSKKRFSRKHDTILWVAKGTSWYFDIDSVRQPYKATSGFAQSGIRSKSGKHYLPNPLGTPVDDVWDIPIVNPMAKERNGYPTQKPEVLLERIIRSSSDVGMLVLDPFSGSGTTLSVAHRLNRRWIGLDRGDCAIGVCKDRLEAQQANFKLLALEQPSR